jgi:hypothetical protein
MPTQPQAGWTTSCANNLAIFGSGFEGMGESDIRAAVGAIAAFWPIATWDRREGLKFSASAVPESFQSAAAFDEGRGRNNGEIRSVGGAFFRPESRALKRENM